MIILSTSLLLSKHTGGLAGGVVDDLIDFSASRELDDALLFLNRFEVLLEDLRLI